jgi:hypothetical protein
MTLSDVLLGLGNRKEMKLCKDCAHMINATPLLSLEDGNAVLRCAKSDPVPVGTEFPINPVTGEIPYQFAALMRYNPEACGLEAKWFEPK